jgi:hypothetical protein
MVQNTRFGAELPTRDVLMIPAVLAGIMAIIGAACSYASGVDGRGLIISYFLTAFGVTVTTILIYLFIGVLQLFRDRPDRPLQLVANRLRGREPFLVLPLLVFPLFLCGFTTAKTAIFFLVGYRWDAFWATADRSIFGDDAWRIAHHLLGSWSMPAWEWLYTIGWGAVLVFCKSGIVLYASPRRIAVFYTAMLSTWLLGGWLTAYAFSAAGPIFAPLVDSSLAANFEPIGNLLGATLPDTSAVRATQHYLTTNIHTYKAVNGGGVSAFPSMHLGAASIYVLAAWKTRWMWPAILFWGLIFVGSAYFGYHYWVDGLAAASIALVCWLAAEKFFAPRPALQDRRVASPA